MGSDHTEVLGRTGSRTGRSGGSCRKRDGEDLLGQERNKLCHRGDRKQGRFFLQRIELWDQKGGLGFWIANSKLHGAMHPGRSAEAAAASPRKRNGSHLRLRDEESRKEVTRNKQAIGALRGQKRRTFFRHMHERKHWEEQGKVAQRGWEVFSSGEPDWVWFRLRKRVSEEREVSPLGSGGARKAATSAEEILRNISETRSGRFFSTEDWDSVTT